MKPRPISIRSRLFSALRKLIDIITNILFKCYYRTNGNKLPPIKVDILKQPAVEVARRIRSKEISSVEVIKACMRRIMETNYEVNCFIENRYVFALEEAKEVDKIIQSGSKTIKELENEKPFLGVPFTTKDSIGVKGLPITAGVFLRKDLIAYKDSDVVRLMKESGAIIIGLTNVPELCIGWETHNYIYGTTNNPYDTNRIVGGSSGGEACIQALGGSCFGIGSDLSGSIRMPAFFNGIFGHKPSRLIVSNVGQYPEVDTDKYNSFLCNPRNKCALQPGHSLMDWIRLGNSGKDLNGIGGRIRPVTPAELTSHNTQGPEELIRGAGIDATELFDKVHPWVNYDSLLAKCLVGPLCADRPDAEELFDITNPSPKSDRLREPSKAQELVRKSMENLANCITPVRKKITTKSEENVKGSPPSKIMQSLIQSSDLPVSISRRAASSPIKCVDKTKGSPPPLCFDWIQTSTKLTISIYTGVLANPGGSARIIDGRLHVNVATNGWLRTVELIPEEIITDPIQLRVFSESGKIEVTASKAQHKVWKNVGVTSFGAATQITSPRTLECRVMHSERVSYDTTLLALPPLSGPVVVPLGHHVRVHHKVNNKECIRSYTPVGEGWDGFGSDISALKLAVKRYEAGDVSPHLTSLQIGDTISLSGPYGNFHLQKLKQVKIMYLLAAGSGITPMLGLLRFMLARSNPRCERVYLMFFNKTKDDILFKENFEEIAKQDKRLNVVHILSNASSSWTGLKGRISSEILSKIIDKDISTQEKQIFFCLCGKTEFTHAGLDLLKKLGVKENDIHAFIG